MFQAALSEQLSMSPHDHIAGKKILLEKSFIIFQRFSDFERKKTPSSPKIMSPLSKLQSTCPVGHFQLLLFGYTIVFSFF